MILNEVLEILSENTSTSAASLLVSEIKNAYSAPGRYYHNLNHLEFMYSQLFAVKKGIHNWPVALLATAYHDVVCVPGSPDNEEKSAAIAEAVMKKCAFESGKIALCVEMILATKSHLISTNNDVNYLVDADMSILGTEPQQYSEYADAVRREFSALPDGIFKHGRAEVIQGFLSRERIFNSHWFHSRYESAAQENLKRELKSLLSQLR